MCLRGRMADEYQHHLRSLLVYNWNYTEYIPVVAYYFTNN